MKLVAADIGGTHARFALAEVQRGRVLRVDEPVTFRTADHASLQGAWQQFAAHCGEPLPPAAGIAVAGPVGEAAVRLTNSAWTIHPAALAGQLGLDRHVLVNDFAAVAHAVAQVSPDRFEHLAGPDRPLPDEGTITVVGPGTGLGVAHLWRGPDGYRVQPTEGGHIDFAPVDSIDDAILARLRKRHRRVSVERIVSGPGIVEIHAALAALEGRAIRDMQDRELWQLALAGDDRLAGAAMERFCLSLGSVAGDLALAQGAAAVVIAGGLGYRIRETLLRSAFAQRFTAKGRFETLMASLPVKLIVHPQPGLFGAAAAFAQAFYGGEHAGETGR